MRPIPRPVRDSRDRASVPSSPAASSRSVVESTLPASADERVASNCVVAPEEPASADPGAKDEAGSCSSKTRLTRRVDAAARKFDFSALIEGVSTVEEVDASASRRAVVRQPEAASRDVRPLYGDEHRMPAAKPAAPRPAVRVPLSRPSDRGRLPAARSASRPRPHPASRSRVRHSFALPRIDLGLGWHPADVRTVIGEVVRSLLMLGWLLVFGFSMGASFGAIIVRFTPYRMTEPLVTWAFGPSVRAVSAPAAVREREMTAPERAMTAPKRTASALTRRGTASARATVARGHGTARVRTMDAPPAKPRPAPTGLWMIPAAALALLVVLWLVVGNWAAAEAAARRGGLSDAVTSLLCTLAILVGLFIGVLVIENPALLFGV